MTQKTAIITGVTGQDGSHLAELLLEKDYKVIGVIRRSSVDTTERVKHLKPNKNLQLVEGDITDVSSVMGILSLTDQVDEIYNLAAQSHVGTSFKQPAATWDITGKGVLNILQAMVDLKMWGTRFYQASSSEMFGSEYDIAADGTKYQDENTKFMPNSPYAIAKCAAHYAVRLYRDAYNIHGSCGILFNHEGPRRGANFVTKKITNYVTSLEDWIKDNNIDHSNLEYNNVDHLIIDGKTGLKFDMLGLGNLESFRDWGYAGDYVEAMWMMVQQDYADDYVICTGETCTIADFLTLAFEESNLEIDWNKAVYIDPAFYRPSEVDYLRGSCKKATETLGWTPKHDLRDLVKLMLARKL
jgi:GDPmannose 4,6-dehydratase